MQTTKTSKLPVLIAWMVVLLVSELPKIMVQEIFKQKVPPDLQAIVSACIVFIALLAAMLWQPLRGLRLFLVLFLVFIGVRWLVYNRLDELTFYRAWLRNPSFNVYMLAEQSLNLIVSLVIIAALFIMGKKRNDFYLVRGNIAAPAGRIRWLGVDQGTPWSKFGFWLTVCISLGTLTFLIVAGRPSLDMVKKVLPFLPAVLLAAAVNAFTEEMNYKASFLSVLESPVGPRQALYMVAVYFGIAHFYGVPYGVIGAGLATFLGWILAKSMQETRGMFWAWLIHFWQDVWIFSFLAVGSIAPGGG